MGSAKRIIIEHGTAITMNSNNDVIDDSRIVIEDDRIVSIGACSEPVGNALPAEELEHAKTLNARGKLIIPGLINAHTHNIYYLMRGLGMEFELLGWLKKAMWPCLSEMNAEEAYIGALLGYAENIKNGNTSVMDNFYMSRRNKANADSIAEAACKSGLRVGLVRGCHDVQGMIPLEFIEPPEEAAEEYERLIATWHGKNDGKISVWLSPVNLLYSSEKAIETLKSLMDKHLVGLHTHVAEAKREVEMIEERFGMGYIEVLDRFGIVGSKFHAAHAVWLSDREIDILAERGATVIHNPASNMLLASGIAPVSKMIARGVNVALGTDSPNNSQDMIESMKLAMLLQRVGLLDPQAMSPSTVLKMATRAGAQALGLEGSLGSIEPGKLADIVIINSDVIHNLPVYDHVTNLVLSGKCSDVETVIIGGEVVMENRVLKTIDEAGLIKEVKRVARDLSARALSRLGG
ncbi:MAG TPA: amidohydrolase [Clostridia bacterium]|nr:amidohydrolase [Clostridia bacterium]